MTTIKEMVTSEKYHHMATRTLALLAQRLIAFYINEYNAKLPHSSFRGQTPDEMYFGAGDGIADNLEPKRESQKLAIEAESKCILQDE